MKKFTLVMSAILMAALLAISAVATPVEFPAGTDKSFDITYTGTEGQYYAIVIVEGLVEEGGVPSITEESIQYIDQQTAGEGGAVSFEDVLLKVDGTQATVFLGGSDLDEVVLLGWVNKTVEPEGPTTFTVSGNVTSASTLAARATLYNAEGEVVVYADTDDFGDYAIDVSAGTYKLVVTKAKHLSYTNNTLVVEADATLDDIELKAGDANNSGEINSADLNIVLVNFGAEIDDGDVNDTGEVNSADLNLVLRNFGAAAIIE